MNPPFKSLEHSNATLDQLSIHVTDKLPYLHFFKKYNRWLHNIHLHCTHEEQRNFLQVNL